MMIWLGLPAPQAALADVSLAHFPSDYADALDSVFSENDRLVREALNYLAQFPSTEALDITKRRILREVDVILNSQSGRVLDKSAEILIAALSTLGSIANKDETSFVIAIKDKFDEKNIFLIYPPKLETSFTDCILQLRHDSKTLVAIPSAGDMLREQRRSNHFQGKSASELRRYFLGPIDAFEKYMRANIVEQDEVVNALVNLNLKERLYARLDQPELFYLIGQPGTGKDTIAQTYVDALWGYENAHYEHLFEVTANNKAEIWGLLGSTSGFVDSSKVGSLIRYLVEHSNGKYNIQIVKEGDREKEVVVENPAWREGENTLLRQPPPVIFINEAHDIPKSVKEQLLKKALLTGRFPINNPGHLAGAALFVQIPNMHIIFASNEGSELLEPRAKNGERIGRPLTYDELAENWRTIAPDKNRLRDAIRKTNGGDRNVRRDDEAPGNSEAFLNRFRNDRIFLLKPISPDGLKKIIQQRLDREIRKLRDEANFQFGSLDLRISNTTIDFIQQHDYIASENARPMTNNVNSIVVDTLMESLRHGRIYPARSGQVVHLDLHTYPSGVSALVFQVDRQGETPYQFTRIIRETLSKRHRQPIPEARIQDLLKMSDKMKQNVFGIDHIVDHLIDRIIAAEAETYGLGNDEKNARRAILMSFLGLTSTGKTETAKQLAQARFGTVEALKVIDFNHVKSVEDIREKIFGTRDAYGEVVTSDFMKHYDAANGRGVVFVFDEIANAPRDLLQALYEIFREKVVHGFVDNKTRTMSNVTIILTGNAGKEIYDNLPADLPLDVREGAMHEVYKDFMQNPQRQYGVLKKHFPEPLIARIGLANIFFFGPHTHKSKRQVTLLKLLAALEEIKPERGKRGWYLQFSDNESFLRLVELIETEGFEIEGQGESIGKYVNEQFKDKIIAKLNRSQIPSGQKIQLDVESDEITSQERGLERRQRQLLLTAANGEKIQLAIHGKPPVIKVDKPKLDFVLTAYHEAGHEIVDRVFFGDRHQSKYLSIRPGVTDTGLGYVHYAGLASSEVKESTRLTKAAVLRHVAKLAAGYVAEELITIGHRSGPGKQNDMQRATSLIYEAIMIMGLSPNWGTQAVPPDMTIGEYIEKHLSEKDRERINEEVRAWLKDGESMARSALLVNFTNALKPLAQKIASQGDLQRAEIDRFYSQHNLITERDRQYEFQVSELEKLRQRLDKGFVRAKFLRLWNAEESVLAVIRHHNLATFGNIYEKLRKLVWGLPAWKSLNHAQHLQIVSLMGAHLQDNRRDVQLALAELAPKEIADIEKLAEGEKQRELAEVVLPEVPLTENSHSLAPNRYRCHTIFSQ